MTTMKKQINGIILSIFPTIIVMIFILIACILEELALMILYIWWLLPILVMINTLTIGFGKKDDKLVFKYISLIFVILVTITSGIYLAVNL